MRSFASGSNIAETNFRSDEMGLKHRTAMMIGQSTTELISMKVILQLIYREYCRSCLQNFKYF